MTRSIYKHYFSTRGRCLDGFKKITFFFGKTSQTGPKSPRKLPLLTQISPSVVSNLTKTLGWVGKQIWENFPKKTRLFLRLPFRRHGHCTQMDTGHFQVDRSVSTAKSASMCDHMIVLCLHEQCPGVAYILKAKKFVELPFQSKKN